MGFFTAWIIYSVLCYFFPVPTGTVKVGPFEKGWFEEWQDVETFDEELVGHEVHDGIEKLNIWRNLSVRRKDLVLLYSYFLDKYSSIFLEYIRDCGIILAVTAFSAIVLATMNFFLAVNKTIWVPKNQH